MASCSKGGSHDWRIVDPPHTDGSVLRQCTKCSEFEEYTPLPWWLWILAIIAAAILLYYFFGQGITAN